MKRTMGFRYRMIMKPRSVRMAKPVIDAYPTFNDTERQKRVVKARNDRYRRREAFESGRPDWNWGTRWER